ncbi:MAG TPA: hypothetical protein VM433_08760, partial [Mycobacteriales bacterium]|nr:hypothetical protein [Mycobacteriales bacterium]
MRRALGAGALCLTLVLSGCAVDARDEIRGKVGDITDAANARDADDVRRGVDELQRLLDSAVRNGEMSSAEAARIAELAALLRERADLLDEQPEPELTPEETEEPVEEPEPEPEPTTPPPTTPPPSPRRARRTRST